MVPNDSISNTVRTRRLRFLGFARESFPEVRRHLRPLVQYEILLKILTFAVWSPLLAFVIRAVAHLEVDTSLANDDILNFFLTPIGMITLVIMLSMGMTGLLAEQTGVMFIFAHGLAGRRVTAVRAVTDVLRKFPGVLAISILRTLIYLAIVIPFFWLGWVYFDRTLGSYDLNYLVQIRPPEFWRGAVVIGVLAVTGLATLMTVHAHLIFSLPIYLFERATVLRSLTRAFRLSRGHAISLVRILLLWLGACTVASIGAEAALEFLEDLVLPRLARDLTLIITVLGLRFFLGLILQALIAMLALLGNAFLVIRCFEIVGGGFDKLTPRPEPGFDKLSPRRIPRWLIWAASVAAVILAGLVATQIVERLNIEDDVTITAHRGSSMVAPENSISAILRAAEDGADYAEIDVQETSDGVLVLLHDTDLLRLTGLDRKIWATSYDDLKDLDAGSWFSPEFAGERIPTLDEAIEAARGRIKLNIEIKLNGHQDALVERVVETVRRHRFESECIVTSLSYLALQEVRELAPEIEIGYIIFQALGRMSRFDVDQLIMRDKLATAVALRQARRAKLATQAWTVNDKRTMHALIDRGIDGILTDYPDRLVEVLRARSELNDVERLLLRIRELN